MSYDYINYIPYQKEAEAWYPKSDFAECMEKYDRYYKDTVLYFESFLKDNAFRHPFERTSAISVWEQLGHGKAAIKSISWSSESELSFRVGEGGAHRVECKLDENGTPTVLGIYADDSEVASSLRAPVPPLPLPAVAGRRYLATPESSTALPDGALLVGTHDTMLARIKDGRVFSLGQVTTAGGVHSLDTAPDGTVWGVAGHKLGVGQLFKYTEEEGVTLLGLVPEVFASTGRCVGIYRPTAIAVSPDGKYIAVGGDDEIGGVVIMQIK